jgi:hypothetical protein
VPKITNTEWAVPPFAVIIHLKPLKKVRSTCTLTCTLCTDLPSATFSILALL